MTDDQGLPHQLIEGISNDVLFAAGVTLGLLILTIAWYSTKLTSGQRNLPEIRATRRGVNIRRIPGSSSSEYTQRLNETSSSTSSSSNEHRGSSETAQVPTQDVEETNDSELSSAQSPSTSGNGVDQSATPASTLTSNDIHSTNTTAPAPSSSSNPEREHIQSSSPLPPGALSIKLMSLYGEEKIVSEPYDTTVIQLREKHYQPELQAGKTVRFIHSGRSLLDDDRLNSLSTTGDHLVLHVSIADRRSQTDTEATLEIPTFNVGVLMVPMFAVVLILLWILRFQFGHLFNVTSTVSLLGITTVFLFSLYSISRGINTTVHSNTRHTTYTIRLNGNGTDRTAQS